MARKHIQDDDRGYSFALHYVKFATRLCYRSFRVHGWDKVPTDGSVIFVSNHTGSLMDPLVQLTAEGHKVVFMARADVFHKPKVAKILRWLRILPVYRIRDGYAAVKSNDKIIDEAVGVLTDRCPLALYPEGTHRTKHSLLPLSKGIFRIALQANDAFGAEKPVYIVPVGLEYADYFHLWDSLTLQIGRPINITAYASEHPDLDRPQLILALRDELTDRMRETFLWVPDDEHYDSRSRALLANPPAPFSRVRPKLWPAWLTAPLLVLLSPVLLLCLLLTVPLWLTDLIARKKVRDRAFLNSVRIVSHVIFFPLSLFLMWPFWLFVEEYLFRLRHLHC